MSESAYKPTWVTRLAGAFAPPKGVTGLESLIMRGLFALVIPQMMPGGLGRTTTPKANGLAQWMDFTWMAQPGMEGMITAVMVLLLILYVVGAQLALVTPALLAITVAVRTMENSAGSIHHGYQVISMILLAQSAVYIWQSSLRRSLLGQANRGPGIQRNPEAWVLWASQMAMAALYLVSVASKIENSHGQWLLNSPGFATEVVKTYRQSYFSRLDPIWGPNEFPKWAAWIAAHPFQARLMFGMGFFTEMFAFLVLLRWRLVGTLVGLGLIGMHASIDVVMGLEFAQNVDCLWIFFVGIPFLLSYPLRGLVGQKMEYEGEEEPELGLWKKFKGLLGRRHSTQKQSTPKAESEEALELESK